MPDFPHMNENAFPHINGVDVYKYRNEFDYSRYDAQQMNLTLCTVPWDMGEAHIGARTISGIGNVVWFETEEKRDAWFNAIPDDECYRFASKYKALHRDNEIIVPVPFDVASTFNYLVVEYEPFASQGDYVQYERPGGIDKWFWFIREVEFLAPNSTRLHLMNDAFQTFMYRMHFAGMILERGHAPMFAIDADTYLTNPIENNEGLLAEDVNFSVEPVRVVNTSAHVFNSETWACIATTASPTSDWGSKADSDWLTPTLASYTVDGVPDVRIFALDVANLNTFLSSMQANTPQFAQTVKGVFFAPKELITLGASFTFCGASCYWVATSNKIIEFTQLRKSQFAYPARYADIAKLYTWPYACLEIVDENGNSQIVRIENTDGSLDISASLSLAYPAISIQAHLLGIGGSSQALAFSNITPRSLRIGGKWHETLHSWNVPVFGIVQSAEKYNDYSEFFDRAQANTALENEYDSTIASAAATRDNALDSADVAHENAKRDANTLQANAQLQTFANSALTLAANSASNGTGGVAEKQITANNAQVAQSNNFIDGTSNSQIDASLQSAAVSAGTGIATGAVSAIASGITGNVAGAVSGIVGGVINAGGAMANAHIAANLTATQAQLAINQNNQKKTTSNTLTSDLASIHASLETANTTTKNDLITGTNTNNAITQRQDAWDNEILVKGGTAQTGNVYDGTAVRSYEIAEDNADRAKDTAQKAISNRLKQRRLAAPLEFGNIANTGQATTKPQALLANVLTQSVNAIAQTGDEFLRYGYRYDMQWNFNGNWNVGKYFTYWKLRDFWVTGLNIPDMYVDKLRFFLYGGVTVWRKPEDIGNRSIYENMEV